jgi:glycyl-tRNA synthetase beta chain
MTDFLLELGVEEIPAGYVEPALAFMDSFAQNRLHELHLAFSHVKTLATPRRLVLSLQGLPDMGPDTKDEFRGPAYAAAFDEKDEPRKAAMGFAKSKGLSPADLEVRQTPKGRYVYAVVQRPGRPTADLLAGLVVDMIPRIPWPKSMHWGAENLSFARPLRSIFARFGETTLDPEIKGVPFHDAVRGHPFLHGGWVDVPTADLDNYVSLLKAHHVWVDHRERRAELEGRIRQAIEAQGGVFQDEDLLTEVTHLVEVPAAAVGSFSDEFLSLPAAVLEAAMMEHQRYFPVRTAEGRLLPRFVVTANRVDHLDVVVRGNERVLLARLWDARFFFNEDRKTTLAHRIEELAGVMYLKGGGTLADKTRRLEATVQHVAKCFSLDHSQVELAARAAKLSKCDLLTEMVGEFPSLQGTMGRIYAGLEGEDPAVAAAVEEHYMPRAQGTALPSTPLGQALSLADRIQTLADCFALGLRPSGSKDPYALRRCALGLLRIVETREGFDLDGVLSFALRQALEAVNDKRFDEVHTDLKAFLRERIYQFCVDRGDPFDLVNAALHVGFLDYGEFLRRLDALTALRDTPWWPGLVTLAERTFNITRGTDPACAVDPGLLAEDAEKALAAAWDDSREQVETALSAGDYAAAGKAYFQAFGEPVHRFFDEVFVNVDDEKLKANRHALLSRVSRLWNDRVANLAEVVTGRGEEGS